MEIRERVNKGDPEDEQLEYKDKESKNRDLAKELTALANSRGGFLVLGVRDDDEGQPELIQSVDEPHSRSDAVTNVIYDRVEPNLEFETLPFEIEGKELVSFQVAKSPTLHSYLNPKIEEPVFPVRRNTRVAYLHGHEVDEHYRNRYQDPEEDEDSSGLFRLRDEDLPEPCNFFIRAPDGHISEICLFSDVIYPNDPVRLTMKADQLSSEEAEHTFAMIDSIFDLSIAESSFTINQSNGAWVGKGFENFVSNLRHQEERYREVREDQGYDLDIYKHDQAVFISDFGMVYPESVLIIYVAPFHRYEGYRHFALNIITDGMPVDIRPLIELSERTDFPLSNAKDVSILRDGIKDPSRVPVEVVEHSTRPSTLPGDTSTTIDGAVCKNPFFNKQALAERELSLDSLDPLAQYEHLYGYLMHTDDIDDPREYHTRSLTVADWNEYTRSVYANVKEVQFSINW